MKKFENYRGITLIALVVTIIVLLILAGISISMLTGQNGILKRAVEAKEETEIANKNEQRKLAQAEALMSTENTVYNGVNIPKGFAPTKIEGENIVDKGLVITDGYGNEYVWVEVPKVVEVYETAGLNITDFNEDVYKKIENDLHKYTAIYRNETEFTDTYRGEYNGDEWFKSEEEYKLAYYNMLKRVYQNGGFWVGRYEAGIDDKKEQSRYYEDDNMNKHETTQRVVIKANAYPYTWVNREQAQNLASNVNSGECTSSLMYGVQWDLMLKFIEDKTVKNAGNSNNLEEIRKNIQNQLNVDSTGIGNYYSSSWRVQNNGVRYSTDHGKTYKMGEYDKKSNEDVILTTGASESFAQMNIYDIAGNVWELTLEASNTSKIVTGRGSSFMNDTSTRSQASFRNDYNPTFNYYALGFRVTLY